MKKDLKILKQEFVPILRSNGVSRSFVFGSYARNEAHEGSDLDLLVSFRERKSLFDLVALKNELEDRLGISVDIVTEQSLNPKLRSYVDREKIQVL